MENLALAVDYGLPGKRMNHGTTFSGWRSDPFDSLVTYVGIISFYLLVEQMCICVYVYIIVNTISS